MIIGPVGGQTSQEKLTGKLPSNVLARRKTPHQTRVETFMKMADQDLPSQPTIPDGKIRELRIRLLLEEVLETANAMGVRVKLRGGIDDDSPLVFEDFAFETTDEVDLVEAVDGLADISVVNVGAMSALGVADVAVLEEVDRNNLMKFDPKGGGYRDPNTGKWIKPKNHPAPDIEAVLKAQGWTG